MKAWRRGLGVSAGALALVAATAGVAAADVGDSNPACNRGEICFSRDYGPTGGYFRYQKHYWYAGNHAGYTWFDTATKAYTGWGIRNDASAVANRDTVCDVRVVNDRGVLADITLDVANVPSTVQWVYLGRVNDANDRHERVRCA